MENKKAQIINDRLDILRTQANEKLRENNSLTYDKAFNIVKNTNGVDNIIDIADVNFGEPSNTLKSVYSTFGDNINGMSIYEMSPEKLEAIYTAYNMGSDISEITQDMSVNDIKKVAIKSRREKEKIKTPNKVLILKKPEKNVA